jgi:glycosyltransferase involved in cell wall biosynthesis
LNLIKHQKDWIGVIVGKGTYEKTLKRYIQKRQVNDTIIFPGPVYNQNELRKIYNQAEILLLTSHHEGIPMTILESLACGTAVLSTDVGGISKLATEITHCHTLRGRDAKIFAQRILEISALPKIFYKNFPYSSELISLKLCKILKDE